MLTFYVLHKGDVRYTTNMLRCYVTADFLADFLVRGLKAHVHPRCIARPVLKKKTFRVVENRCLQCVESILVNLPQFAKFCLKESLNRCFWYFSLHLSEYFGLVSSLFVSVSVCFTAVLSMAAPSKRTVGRPHRLGSPKYIRLRGSVFLISREMGKKLLAANSTNSVFADFLLLSNVDVQL